MGWAWDKAPACRALLLPWGNLPLATSTQCTEGRDSGKLREPGGGDLTRGVQGGWVRRLPKKGTHVELKALVQPERCMGEWEDGVGGCFFPIDF